MHEHRFTIGQIVRLTRSPPGESGMQRYKVLRHLPAEREGPQYRIKSMEGSNQERIALESQIQGLG